MVRGVTPAHKGLAPSRLINYISVVKRCPCWAHTFCISNSGEVLNIKVCDPLTLCYGLTRRHCAIPYCSYNLPLRTNAFVPSKVAITDLVSSGKLNLLTNDSLKNDLLRYYGELDKLLYQLEINRSKSLEKVFLYKDHNQFGNQYFDYVAKSLGNEILETLPVNNWHLDSESKYYKQFQNDLVFFVTMSEREKQHFDNILKEMESTYNRLKKECNSNIK